MINVSMKVKIIVPVVIIVVFAAVSYYFMLNTITSPKQVSATKPLLIRVKSLHSSTVRPMLSLYAKVMSHQDASLSSPYFSKVQEVYVKAGAHVAKGQLLVMLDTDELYLTLTQTRADIRENTSQIQLELLRQAKAKTMLINDRKVLQNSEEAYSRKKKLFKQKHLAKENLDQAESAYHQQLLQIKGRQFDIKESAEKLNTLYAKQQRLIATKEKAKKDINDARVKAPFNAKIKSVSAVVGKHVQLGAELLTLYNPDEIELKVMIPNKYLHQLRRAQEAGTPVLAKIKKFGKDSNLNLRQMVQHLGEGEIGQEGYFGFVVMTQHVALGEVIPIEIYLPERSHVYSLPRSAFYRSDTIYLIKNKRLKSVEVQRFGITKNSTEEKWIIFKSDKVKIGDRVLISRLPNPVTGQLIKVSTAVGE